MNRTAPFILIYAVVANASGETYVVPADYPTVQEAINAVVDGDEIVVAPGTYFEAIDFLGKAITLRSSSGPDVTIIDGTGFLHVVQCVSGEDVNTVVQGFTITGGDANGGSFPDNAGGGMYNFASSPAVIDCTFSGNAASYGGGMYNGGGSDPHLTACTFSGNTTGAGGGGMYNGGGSSPTVTACAFDSNTAGFGGGLANGSSSSPTVIDCTFNGNSASGNGGGMLNFDSSPAVVECTFTANTAGHGGGMHNINGSSPIVQGCIFADNETSFGGGMHNHGGSSPLVANCVFSGNAVDVYGGGLRDGYQCSSTLINSVFTGNSAALGGGAIAAGSDTEGSTGHTIVTNCILWGDASAVGPEIALIGQFAGSMVTVAYSDVQGGQGDVYVQPGSSLIWGAGNIEADPLFIDPDSGDYHLAAGSPCIDAADNTAVSADGLDLDGDGDVAEPIPFDLDGTPRFQNDLDTADSGKGDCRIVDMGSYEFPTTCPWDLDCNAAVGVTDLLLLLAAWGTIPGGPPDFDGDANVGVTDLLTLLANWGSCP